MSNFKTKARAIELLGRKQIRDSITALAELMKNSYDADAPWLRVEFNTLPGNLVIADGGCGMTKNDIETKWLVLGTDSKTTNKSKTSTDGRPLMGAKGIGRLASARLGKQLWLITKAKEANWNIVYINWDVFENPYISLDEINIPSKYNIPANELLITFEAIKKQLISEQLKNIQLKAWFNLDDNGNIILSQEGNGVVRDDMSELYNMIIDNIKSTSLIDKNIQKYISSIKQGTILFIDTLNDDWDKYLAPISNEQRKNDVITQKYYNRFASFISTFRHTKVNKIPFDVQVYINNSIWDEDYNFTSEDYSIYDIKISGYVENGKFYGEIDALNAEQKLLEKCNNILKNGIDVTKGIANWENIDCGKYSIKLCHIEGEHSKSGLSKDDYDRIRRKLAVVGGVSIFRDGVRILPYGEPENDFLNMEQRRSFNTGNYIFSHRNIFGRIDINSTENPFLEDKSSREGLIENDQYFYFVKTIENLLVDLAWNYLSSARKSSLGIRDSFINKNKEIVEAKKKAAGLEKAELSASKLAINETKSAIATIKQKFRELEILCINFKKEIESQCESTSLESGYNVIHNSLDVLSEKYDNLVNLLNDSKNKGIIDIPKRYAHYYSEELKNEVKDINESTLSSINQLYVMIEMAFNNAMQKFETLLALWKENARVVVQQDPFDYQNLLKDRLAQVIENSRDLTNQLLQFVDENSKAISNDMKSLLAFIDVVTRYSENLQHSESYMQIQELISNISGFNLQIEELLNGNVDGLFERGNEVLTGIENEYQIIYKNIELLKLSSAKELGNLQKQASFYASNTEDSVMPDEYVIGILRQENVRLQAENEIYGDLANLGLASEIVNHEFNQLFSNVNNAIKNLAPYIKDGSPKYWLNQIEIGFRAISDRQNQLSPMYRSYSLRKRKVNLYDFVNGVCRFMESVFKRDEIVIDNQIDNNVALVISPSKLFPVISNILNNAAYWVLNQNEKIIRFRYDEDISALYIEDSGAGITAFDQESIFEPFVSYKPNGRGLGLAIVKKVLESQGYTISIASESEKTLSGACFVICFNNGEAE